MVRKLEIKKFKSFYEFSTMSYQTTVQTEINLYEIVCKRHATGLQLACERLAEGEASEARQAFKRLVSCLQKACKWLAEAH